MQMLFLYICNSLSYFTLLEWFRKRLILNNALQCNITNKMMISIVSIVFSILAFDAHHENSLSKFYTSCL